MNAHSGQQIEVSILKDAKKFIALEEEWHDLYQNSPHATPFQSWAWLYSWWESYGEDYELRLVVIRADGVLVGLLPMMLERNRGFRKLLFVGTGITDYNDVLVRRGWEAPVTETGRRVLEQMGDWHVADLQELRPAAFTWRIFEGWSGPKSVVRQSGCPIIETKPWDELLASLSRNHRKIARRTLRRMEADGLRRELAKPTEAGRVASDLIRLNREQWQGRAHGKSPGRQLESHLVATIYRMSTSGLGGVSEFRQDGEVVASLFWMLGKNSVEAYMIGTSQKVLERYSISTLYIWEGTEIARQRGSSYLSLLRGEEPYKLRWASEVIPNHLLILGHKRFFWAPYAGYRTLRSKARRYVEAEDTPSWAKGLANRLRG